MSIVNDYYRGKTVYIHVLAELVRAAQYRGVTTYQDIALIMGLPASGNYMSMRLGQVLGEISEDEHKAGRPMLSAVAIGANGQVGEGFFTLACALGKLAPGEDKEAFWKKELEAVYAAWRRPIRTMKKESK